MGEVVTLREVPTEQEQRVTAGDKVTVVVCLKLNVKLLVITAWNG